MPATPSDDTIRAMLAQRVEACRLSPGMVVGITERGDRRLIAHGRADAFGSSLTEGALFEIGSVTKLFTVLLLADMACRREVSLDEPVVALLPTGVRVPERNGRAITLAHLATHLSGLPCLPTNFEPNDPANPYADYTAERLYDFLSACELARTPGDTFEYSNLGVGLLGHALALRGGIDYATLVQSRILVPLGMNATAVGLSGMLAARLAPGHDDSLEPVAGWDFAALAGSGGFRSCAADLLLFLEALIAPDTSPLGLAAGILVAPPEQRGLGLGLLPPEGHMRLQHEGRTGGYCSYVGCISAWRRGVVVLANAAVYGAVADLGVHILDTRWAPLWHRQEVAIDPMTFDRLVGRYRINPTMVLDVTRAEDRLFVQPTGQAACRFFPTSERQFFCKAVGAQITFEPGPNGRVARLILHQNSRDQIAERVGIDGVGGCAGRPAGAKR